MEKKIMLTYLCVILLAIMIPTCQGKFCTKRWHYYAAQNYCTWYTVAWVVWCTHTAYRRIVVYELGKVCCPGFTGKDCSTPICRKPCKTGYDCTSPDECTPNPNSIASVSNGNSNETVNNIITNSTESKVEVN
uniref:EMI domain-containing protein n=2 Tax=Magallana gigas TaxID=29159 RepID=A0A8W8M5E1_MAGGI|nr:uncharacterized protein LOC105342108 isoform X2 [Crassostrea gigas]